MSPPLADLERLRLIAEAYSRYLDGTPFTFGDLIAIAPELNWPQEWIERPDEPLPFNRLLGVGILFRAIIDKLGSIYGVVIPLALTDPQRALDVMRTLTWD